MHKNVRYKQEGMNHGSLRSDSKRKHQHSDPVLVELKEGLLYPALHRMEQDGLLKSEWRSVAGLRRRKYYFITEEGRKVLVNSVAEWTTFTDKLMQVIGGRGHVEPEFVPG